MEPVSGAVATVARRGPLLPVLLLYYRSLGVGGWEKRSVGGASVRLTLPSGEEGSERTAEDFILVSFIMTIISAETCFVIFKRETVVEKQIACEEVVQEFSNQPRLLRVRAPLNVATPFIERTSDTLVPRVPSVLSIEGGALL